MNTRNYEIFDKVLSLEFQHLIEPANPNYKLEWRKLRSEYSNNLNTLYRNKKLINNLIEYLQPYTRIDHKNALVVANLSELLHIVKRIE
jgi:hypothetical protein